ncbi:MAG: hypothetical protein IJ033_03915 [Clostridia bacterium]|nr:hypothetical protein [Clostridia bacterium]
MHKKKLTILISVSVTVLLLVAGIVLAIVFWPDKVDDQDYDMPPRKMQYEYYVDHEDKAGFYLSDNFRAEVPLKEFTKTVIESADGLVLGDDLLVKVEDGVEIGAQAVYNFSYKNKVIAVVNVYVIDADAYINNATELLAVSADKTYIVKNAIDLTGVSGNVSRFIGTIHFNHHPVSGFNVENGGLFKELDGATITGLDLTGVSGTLTHTNYGNLGVIANYANNTRIRYSSVRGSVSIHSTASSTEALYVGGMIGYANAVKRKDYTTEEVGYVQLVSYLDLSVSGSGDLKVGGLIGGVRNATLGECYAYGKTKLSVDENSVGSLGNIYLGGLVGVLTKQYDAVTTSYLLDESSQLYSYSDIEIAVNGGGAHNSINVGGIFGLLQNHSIVNAIYGGDLDVSLTRAPLNIGGIIGSTDNSTALKMNVRAVEVKGEIEIYSLASVNAGGLIGVSVETQYSNVIASVMPKISTDTSKKQGTQVAVTAIASEN